MAKATKSETTTEKKSVVKKEEAGLPISAEELATMSGQGFEDADKDAYAIPFLRILQTNSPQCNEDEEAYIKGSKPGMIFNTITGELYGKSVRIIAIHYGRSFIEWAPNRGGFIKDHGKDPIILERVSFIDDKNNSVLDNGNIIQDTRNHFILLADHLEQGPIIMSMSSTAIKHSRKFMTLMSNLRLPNGAGRAPMFAGVWNASTIMNENDQGKWYGFGDKSKTCIEFEGWVSKDQLNAALSARDLITSGEAKADWDSTVDDSNARDVNSTDGQYNGGDDADVPF